MGSPDKRQIDGLGGTDPLTSKVAIIKKSERDGIDVDYLFAQVAVDQADVDVTPNCGNMLAGVGPFAIERGLVKASDPITRVKIYMENSANVAEAIIQTPGGRVRYDGDAKIHGVPGTSAPIPITFLDAEGSACGSLLPTGQIVDVVDGIEVTCIDNGMPVVVIRATDLDCTGYETAVELNANSDLKKRLESLRLQLGPMMNLGNAMDCAIGLDGHFLKVLLHPERTPASEKSESFSNSHPCDLAHPNCLFCLLLKSSQTADR